jgi:hypothetical protein
MSKLIRFVRPKSIIPLAVACMFLALTLCSRAQSTAPLDKHARRIEKRLTKFPQGTVLDFEFRDSFKTFGSLGPLSPASFQFTDSDSNKTQTHFYSDLVEVKKAREYIGEGSEPRHHVRLVPVIIVAGVAAAGIATYEIVR